MTKTAFITGINGQDGAYLAQLLLKKKYTVHGLVHSKDVSNLEYLGLLKKVKLHKGNLANKSDIAKLIKKLKPTEIYHLGGLTAPGDSWKYAERYTKVNTLGALNLLEAMKEYSPKSKFFNAATSEMFGRNSTGGLQVEETPFHPTNPYAVTKIYSYWMTKVYRESYNLFCANGILFSHESPLRAKRFVTRKITDGVAKIKLGLAKKITLGNIESKRDWGYAGDYVEAMHRILQQKKPDDFVVSSGKTHSIKDFLKLAFECVGIKDWKKYIEIDPALYRPVDLTHLYGYSGKAKKVLKWEAKTGLKKLVTIMVDADLKRNA